MLHIIRMLERRFPQRPNRFAPVLLLASMLALVAGVIVFTAR